METGGYIYIFFYLGLLPGMIGQNGRMPVEAKKK